MKPMFVISYRRALAFIIIMLMIGGVFTSAQINEENLDLEDTISISIPIGSYEIINNEEGQEIFVEDFGSLLVPGKPNLPSKIFSFAIPPGAEFEDITFQTNNEIKKDSTLVLNIAISYMKFRTSS